MQKEGLEHPAPDNRKLRILCVYEREKEKGGGGGGGGRERERGGAERT